MQDDPKKKDGNLYAWLAAGTTFLSLVNLFSDDHGFSSEVGAEAFGANMFSFLVYAAWAYSMYRLFLKKRIAMSEETKNHLSGKWWHRLKNVMVYGSTAIVALAGLIDVEDFFLTVMASVAWFTFWNFIVYRTALYVAFGTRKNNIGRP